MKTTLDLPDEIIREMKLRAVVQGRTLRDLAADLLRRGLGMLPLEPSEKPLASSMVKIVEGGLPVITCHPQAPTTHMSMEELLNLEQETQTEADLKHAGLSL
ncbi:MAG: hypothetical protein WCP34_15360 [Pseudomonadota bacterium]